jgi:hypothetical protein
VTAEAGEETRYRFLSLSGGGFRAALFHLGVLRAFQAAGRFDLGSERNVIVNAVSGGALPAILWRQYLHSVAAEDPDNKWPEEALLDLVCSSPRLGGQFNWQVAGAWKWAGLKWQQFLTRWWARQVPGTGVNLLARMGGRSNVQILIEMLDYNYGGLWLYDGQSLHRANRDFFKTGFGFFHFPLSPPQATAAATAFPILFRGLETHGLNDESYLLGDAGVIDNHAMLPLLEVIKRQPPHGDRLGGVDFWFLADAGKPMSVPSGALPLSKAITVPVPRLSLVDRIFRLTGDLAQPHSSSALVALLRDYAGVNVIGVGLDQVWEIERPWRSTNQPDWSAAKVPTTLGRTNREDALCVMAVGAQSASHALCLNGLMTAAQRNGVKKFFGDLK